MKKVIILHVEGLRFKDKHKEIQLLYLIIMDQINLDALISIRIVIILLSILLFHSYSISTR